MDVRAAPLALLLCSCTAIVGIDDLAVHSSAKTGEANQAGGEMRRDSGTLEAANEGGAPSIGTPKNDGKDNGGSSGDPGATPTCTTLPTNETFAMTPGAPWIMRGSTGFANPGIRLTPNQSSVTGSFIWGDALTFDRLDVSFSYKLTDTGLGGTFGPGDGLAVAWISAGAPPALGGLGGGMGVEGLQGWAVAVDVYRNEEFADPPVPAITIKKTDDMSNLAATGTNAALIDGNVHTVRVRLSGGNVTVLLDGADVLGPTAIPGYQPYSGYLVFGAGTGGAVEEHLLTSVTMRVGTTGPCAAP